MPPQPTRALSHVHVLLQRQAPPTNPLLLLHGSGGSEKDLLPLAEEIAANAPALSLRGSERWEDGFAFFRRFGDRSIDERNLAANAHSLGDFVETACATYRFELPPIAVGFSNGAIMAAALLIIRPNLLAGAILFRPLAPFARPTASPLCGVPVLIIDGKQDTRRKPGDGHHLAAQLRNAEARIDHHVLDTGHDISSEDRSIAKHWLHHAAAPNASPASASPRSEEAV